MNNIKIRNFNKLLQQQLSFSSQLFGVGYMNQMRITTESLMLIILLHPFILNNITSFKLLESVPKLPDSKITSHSQMRTFDEKKPCYSVIMILHVPHLENF